MGYCTQPFAGIGGLAHAVFFACIIVLALVSSHILNQLTSLGLLLANIFSSDCLK